MFAVAVSIKYNANAKILFLIKKTAKKISRFTFKVI